MDVDGFLRSLYAFLRAKGRCFERGAFVFELDESTLGWAKGVVARGKARRVALTHAGFRSQREWEAHRPRAATREIVQALTPEIEVPIAFDMQCGSGTEKKRVALVYIFAVSGKKFMFMKLESYPAASAHHARDAAARYVLKKAHRSAYPSRREDSYKNTKKTNVREIALDKHAFGTNGNYDSRIRIGSEMFVPAHVLRSVISDAGTTFSTYRSASYAALATGFGKARGAMQHGQRRAKHEPRHGRRQRTRAPGPP